MSAIRSMVAFEPDGIPGGGPGNDPACIDEPGLVLGEVSGGGGDVAGLAARRLPGDGGRPNLREPVSQV